MGVFLMEKLLRFVLGSVKYRGCCQYTWPSTMSICDVEASKG